MDLLLRLDLPDEHLRLVAVHQVDVGTQRVELGFEASDTTEIGGLALAARLVAKLRVAQRIDDAHRTRRARVFGRIVLGHDLSVGRSALGGNVSPAMR